MISAFPRIASKYELTTSVFQLLTTFQNFFIFLTISYFFVAYFLGSKYVLSSRHIHVLVLFATMLKWLVVCHFPLSLTSDDFPFRGRTRSKKFVYI